MTAETNLGLWQHGGPPEPSTLMHVTAEVWPLAADEQGIWLLSGDWPLVTPPIAADGDPHADLELELIRAQMLGDTALLHQTSSRVDGPSAVLTYMAVIRCQGSVRARWPHARPVSRRVAEVVGKPPTHGAAEAPEVRHWDVLLHGLRHLAFQLGAAGDATLAAALEGPWGWHLAGFTPTLYRLYDRVHQAS